MTTPFIRPYDPSRDYEDGLHVFLETINSDLDYSPAREIGSHLWYKPYVLLTPQTCVVLDDGNGRVVGYCIGTSNTTQFSERWKKEFVPPIDEKTIPQPGVDTKDKGYEREECKTFRSAVYTGECSQLLAYPDILKTYPAHMHIDILPEYQRKGWGTKLITSLLEKVKSEGAEGIHLDMVRSNENAARFYEGVGFERAPVIMDGGKSGEMGYDGEIVVTLVKKL